MLIYVFCIERIRPGQMVNQRCCRAGILKLGCIITTIIIAMLLLIIMLLARDIYYALQEGGLKKSPDRR